jgi:crotonobetainyl-CoA:carnitine CoA-transferase CaiB-like acyl-CoA transferase
MTTNSTGPLAGLRVLELGVLIAGPFCGQLLGDMGAEVIKIEPPGQGDPFRQWGNVHINGKSAWFATLGRNKLCATLDLRKPEGQQALRDLASKSDILIENFRPGTLEKWGLGYDVLRKLNPGIIMVRVSGYGQDGPYSPKAGYASVGEAMGGLRYVMGEADRKPSRAGISLGDTLAAMFGTLGALSALEHRRKTGEGQIVDSAIYESVMGVMESLIPEYQLAGYQRERSGPILPKIAPSNIYEASDGMVIIAANQDGVFARLCEAMGRPEWAGDQRYKDHHARGENQAELDAAIDAWSRTHKMAELEAIMEQHGVPCGRVNRAKDILEDPHVAARQALVTVRDALLGDVTMQNVFPKLSATPGSVRWTGKEMGEDNDYVLGTVAGYDEARIAALRTSGII